MTVLCRSPHSHQQRVPRSFDLNPAHNFSVLLVFIVLMADQYTKPCSSSPVPPSSASEPDEISLFLHQILFRSSSSSSTTSLHNAKLMPSEFLSENPLRQCRSPLISGSDRLVRDGMNSSTGVYFPVSAGTASSSAGGFDNDLDEYDCESEVVSCVLYVVCLSRIICWVLVLSLIYWIFGWICRKVLKHWWKRWRQRQLLCEVRRREAGLPRSIICLKRLDCSTIVCRTLWLGKFCCGIDVWSLLSRGGGVGLTRKWKRCRI